MRPGTGNGAPGLDSPLLKGWRREALGEPLLDLLTRGGKVSLDWNGQALRTD